MSFTPAKPVTSSQQKCHDNLETLVQKHLESCSQKPIAEHNITAFCYAQKHWKTMGQPPVVLDSGCGTGESSRHLATIYPKHLVIGIDRSLKRLENTDNQGLPDNCLLLRAECTDFWRLAEQAGWQFTLHTLFYPNPYPKAKHLQRRWHGDAAWPSLLAISRKVELRTNWEIYAREFHHALLLSEQYRPRYNDIQIRSYHPEQTITAFERKYQASGHVLWQVSAGNMLEED